MPAARPASVSPTTHDNRRIARWAPLNVVLATIN
jgi:hypothetical protein